MNNQYYKSIMSMYDNLIRAKNKLIASTNEEEFKKNTILLDDLRKNHEKYHINYFKTIIQDFLIQQIKELEIAKVDYMYNRPYSISNEYHNYFNKLNELINIAKDIHFKLDINYT